MQIQEFVDRLGEFPHALDDADHEALSKSGDLVEAKAVIRIHKRSGRMASTIHNRRSGQDVQQVYSNHPGAKVNEQDPRWRNPPVHWLTTSLIDSMPEILQLFAEGARDAIRSVIR